MKVIIIMACALVGTIALLLFAGISRWSFIYLICQCICRREPMDQHFEISATKTALAIAIAIISLIVFAILLIYGVPFVARHFSELPLLPAA